MRDTRKVFEEFTTRKPGTWEEVESVQVTETMREALADKPTVDFQWGQTPLDHDERFDREINGGRMEFLLRRGLNFYYVNTEGFCYVRYTVRLIGLEEKNERA